MVDGVKTKIRSGAGDMSVEDILRIDWERNYKDKGIDFMVARASFKVLIDSGALAGRLGNTIIFVIPVEGFYVVKFHTMSADDFDTFTVLLLKFFISLHKTKGTSVAFTYVNDKIVFNKIRKTYGQYVFLEENEDEPQKGKYKLILEIGSFTVDMERQRGVLNGMG